MSNRPILLSPPELSADDIEFVSRALESGWLAPAGPELEAFEAELCQATGKRHGVALGSGTAGLHLALLLSGAGPGRTVFLPSLTFVASANAVTYTGAEPVFIDSEYGSWNMCPDRLAEALAAAARAGRLPAAVMTVDLFGQCADYGRILPLCRQYGVPLIEDAAEGLGALYRGQPAGRFGDLSVLSFNGNKIITTSGGGALLSDDPALVARARYLSTQARANTPEYHHEDVGFNYRLSNLLAALGRSQLRDLGRRVLCRRQINGRYRTALGDLPGLSFMPEAPGCESTFWLTCIQIDPAEAGLDAPSLHAALAAQAIETRPVWKPMHLQPIYRHCQRVGGEVAEALYQSGLCLPSGSGLSLCDQNRICEALFSAWQTPKAAQR